MTVETATPETMNQAGFAAFAGVSRKTVTVWKSKGYLVMTNDGLVSVRPSITSLRDRGLGRFSDGNASDSPAVSSVTARKEPDSGSESGEMTAEEIAERLVASPDFQLLTHAEAERLKENYLALAQRLKYERDAGRLVDATEVEARHATRWAEERTAWENWPSSVCADMAAQLGVDPISLRVILEAAVEKHLAERVRRGTDASAAR